MFVPNRESFDFIPELEVDGGGLLAVPDRSFFQPGLCLYRPPGDGTGTENLVGCADLALPPAQRFCRLADPERTSDGWVDR